ncbi:ComEA family DNA-binding protein [Dyadobacter sp. CY323]|uniref:ComEA family DNA-binding protein n=1 Tax=Dyadobacter sp. CY323 TaxID=2907302 RepID=UPI001F4549EF|nr:helix-hairpin-helix domain-containing protein [Dyadobacter sp. CY323]MCE6992408.1 helix-hairpin-helix domain-containing protein [Dyadobacter sp. CY323]
MYRKFIERLQDYFGISRKEARGALVLLVICSFLIWMPFVFRRWILPLVSTPEPMNMHLLDSMAVELEKEVQPKLKNRTSHKNDDFKSSPKVPVRYFDFDPNTASVESLTQLGVPAFLAKRIDKFRSKGGKFRKKEDLLNIYDFPSNLYEKLEKHIVLPVSNAAQKDLNVKKNASDPRSIPRAYNKPAIQGFDINTVDTTELVKLKGIGTKLSMRILKFRDALGGFYSENQYTEIFGLDSLALSELRKYAKVSCPVKKININAVTAAELGRHSYMRDRKIVSIIINYRNQHGPYQNIEDLKKSKVVDDAFIKKIEPYLEF